MNTRIFGRAILVGVALFAGCSGGSMSGYDWSLYDHIKLATPEAQASHVQVLTKMVADADEAESAPRPGACAELGYLLVATGESERGLALLDRESALYPESVRFVVVLKRLATGAEPLPAALPEKAAPEASAPPPPPPKEDRP